MTSTFMGEPASFQKVQVSRDLMNKLYKAAGCKNQVEFDDIVIAALHAIEATKDRDQLRQRVAELEATLAGKISEELSHDLLVECERAIKQRDEFLRTGVSTAGHGGSHDTCFDYIVRRHLLPPA